MKTLLNISEGAIIALHSVILLAQEQGKSIRLSQIAKLFGFSKEHLSKIMQRLDKAGFIHSERGPKGGFSLAKKTTQIKLLDIYEVIEGKTVLPVCLINAKKCIRGKCVLGDILANTNKEFKKILNRKLSDIVKESRIKL